MRYLIIVGAFVLLCGSCKKTAPYFDSFSFNLSGGFIYCPNGSCVKNYIVSNGTLKLKDSVFANDKYQLAKQLADDLPVYLRIHPNASFGCPGCADMPGIHLQVIAHGITTYWTLDPDTAHLPVELKDYATKVVKVIQQLK